MRGVVELPSGKKPASASAGAIAAVGSRLAARLLGLGLVLLCARLLDRADFATYSYLLAVGDTALLFLDSGVAAIAGRHVAQGRVDPLTAWTNAFPLQLATGVVAGSVVLTVATLAPGPSATLPEVALVALVTILNSAFNIQAEFIRASGRAWAEAVLQCAISILYVVIGIAALLAWGTLVGLLFALTCKSAVAVVSAQLMLRLRVVSRPDWSVIRTLIAPSLWLAVGTSGLALVWRFAQFVLANEGTASSAADYAVAVRLQDLAVAVAQTAGFGLMPALARGAGRSGTAARRPLLVWGIALATVAFEIVCVICFVYRRALASAGFGSSYLGAADTIGVFLLGAPLLVLVNVVWYVALAYGYERVLALAGTLGLVSAVGLGVWLASHPSPVAAAVCTLTASTVISCVVIAGLVTGRRKRRVLDAP